MLQNPVLFFLVSLYLLRARARTLVFFTNHRLLGALPYTTAKPLTANCSLDITQQKLPRATHGPRVGRYAYFIKRRDTLVRSCVVVAGVRPAGVSSRYDPREIKRNGRLSSVERKARRRNVFLLAA